jgi:hypothetical protein
MRSSAMGAKMHAVVTVSFRGRRASIDVAKRRRSSQATIAVARVEASRIMTVVIVVFLSGDVVGWASRRPVVRENRIGTALSGAVP